MSSIVCGNNDRHARPSADGARERRGFVREILKGV
jgi:hypothetical protein